jgi:hypothetical protein
MDMKTRLLSAGAILALSAGVAGASTTFSGSFSVDANDGYGLEIETYASTYNIDLELDLGESETFGLFWIWTDESDVGSDDYVAQPIEVAFDFTNPASTGSVDGDTDGHTAGLFGRVQWGSVEWDGVETFSFGDGGAFTVELSDAVFNTGRLWGLNEGEGYGALVEATVTYTVAPVPLPAAGGMLLAGLGALAAFRRRKA